MLALPMKTFCFLSDFTPWSERKCLSSRSSLSLCWARQWWNLDALRNLNLLSDVLLSLLPESSPWGCSELVINLCKVLWGWLTIQNGALKAWPMKMTGLNVIWANQTWCTTVTLMINKEGCALILLDDELPSMRVDLETTAKHVIGFRCLRQWGTSREWWSCQLWTWRAWLLGPWCLHHLTWEWLCSFSNGNVRHEWLRNCSSCYWMRQQFQRRWVQSMTFMRATTFPRCRRDKWSWPSWHNFLPHLMWSGWFWAGFHWNLDSRPLTMAKRKLKTQLMKMTVVNRFADVVAADEWVCDPEILWADLLVWLPLNELLDVLLCCTLAFENLSLRILFGNQPTLIYWVTFTTKTKIGTYLMKFAFFFLDSDFDMTKMTRGPDHVVHWPFLLMSYSTLMKIVTSALSFRRPSTLMMILTSAFLW